MSKAMDLTMSFANGTLQIWVSILVTLSFLALIPIARLRFEPSNEARIRAFISSQFIGNFFILLAIYWLELSADSVSLFSALTLSIFFRIGIPFSSTIGANVMRQMTLANRSFFFLTAIVFCMLGSRLISMNTPIPMRLTVATASLFALLVLVFKGIRVKDSRFIFLAGACAFIPLVCIGLNEGPVVIVLYSLSAIGGVILNFAAQKSLPSAAWPTGSEFELRFFQSFERLLVGASRLSHRIIGPIIVEWIVIKIPKGVLVALRLLTRTISYMSLQRLMATSIAIAIIMMIVILRF